jgi:hypothetical protein
MMRLSLIEMQECSVKPSQRTWHSLPGCIRDRPATVGTGALRRPRRRAQRQATPTRSRGWNAGGDIAARCPYHRGQCQDAPSLPCSPRFLLAAARQFG